MIVEIRPDEVLAGCRATLGLHATVENHTDEVLLASLLRHGAGIYCPCSRTTLQSTLLDSLRYIVTDETSLPERIDAAIEGLIIGGDLLELSDVATDDPTVKGTWLFPAPPSYVARPSGSVFLIGIAPDQDTFLPHSLAARVTYEGFTRVIFPEQHEDLVGEIREQGLQELSESVWLKCPKRETAETTLSGMNRRLLLEQPAGVIKDVQILDPAKRVTYYPGRWSTPQGHSGNLIARRPQEYGAPIWGYASFEGGVAVRFLDLPVKKTRWRGCDAAWHLQMAIDHLRHTPQLYRRRSEGNNVRLDFFSPLPQWAQRRLMIFGSPVARERSLISYQLPAAEAETEEHFLRDRLWLSCSDDSDDRGA